MKTNLNKFLGRISLAILAILVLFTALWTATAHAEPQYPAKPIDVIVPFKPGGGTDSSTRVVTAFLSKKWGVPINVVNKPGGNTLPGSMEVFDARPNGYTLLADCNASSSMLPVVMKNIPYNIMDRTFLGIFTRGPVALMVPAKSPFKTLDDVKAEQNNGAVERAEGERSVANQVVEGGEYQQVQACACQQPA